MGAKLQQFKVAKKQLLQKSIPFYLLPVNPYFLTGVIG